MSHWKIARMIPHDEPLISHKQSTHGQTFDFPKTIYLEKHFSETLFEEENEENRKESI